MNDVVNLINNFLMYDIFGLPFVVIFVIISAIFTIFRTKFIFLKEIFKLKNDNKYKNDEISGFSAFMSAAGSTLGMGNIVGGAVAVTIGGAGSLFWIVIFSIFLSSLKFAETFLGHKYREDKNGIISGGAFFYIKKGFSEIGFVKFGSYLAIIYAICFIFAYTAAGAFQLNQIVSLVQHNILHHYGVNEITIGLFVMIPTLYILFGGIKKIGDVSSKLVPFMVFGHLFCSIFIIIQNIHNFDDVLALIIKSAFNGNAKTGGIIFVLAYSMQRILFASDSGTGAAAVANSNSNKTSIQQASIVAFEPILVALMMIMSGLVVLLTNSHNASLDGIHIINSAFAHGGSLILFIFWVNISLFGLTSIIGDGYYVQKAFHFMTNGRFIPFIKIIYCIICLIMIYAPFSFIMPLSDACFFASILINSIALIFLSSKILKN